MQLKLFIKHQLKLTIQAYSLYKQADVFIFYSSWQVGFSVEEKSVYQTWITRSQYMGPNKLKKKNKNNSSLVVLGLKLTTFWET